MGLVDYASDDSEDEVPTTATKPVASAPAPSKPAIQKVVDRNNPHRIRVNLPGGHDASPESLEPDPKRIKLGSGGRGGINAFLPAPKRPAATPASAQSSTSRFKGLSPGFSLKTGAEPAFSRAPAESSTANADDASRSQSGANEQTPTQPPAGPAVSQQEDFKPKGKTTRFMPLSVARKPKPKIPPKSAALPSAGSDGASSGNLRTPSGATEVERGSSVQSQTKPKISLFSMSVPDEPPDSASATVEGAYEPLLYGNVQRDSGDTGQAYTSTAAETLKVPPSPMQSGGQAQSLDAIASDLNLSAAERRQLFGRAGAKGVGRNASTAINVVNFNTDAEYAANEEIRATGEQPDQSHRVVRTVNTSGKNSLRSLVNVVSNQGEALEEHFAKGKRNKQEAGSKYGW